MTILTYDEAVALLPDGDVIHTYVGLFIGADWNRAGILGALEKAERIERNPPGCILADMGHPIAVLRPGGCWLHIEGKP